MQFSLLFGMKANSLFQTKAWLSEPNEPWFILYVHMKTNEITSNTMWAVPRIHFSWNRGLKGLRGLSFKSCFVAPLDCQRDSQAFFRKEESSSTILGDPRPHRGWESLATLPLCSLSCPSSHRCFPGILSLMPFFLFVLEKVTFTWSKLFLYPLLPRQEL